jgi:hypothetical protein
MIDRDKSTPEAARGGPAQDETPSYEPPTLTVLGSLEELTRAIGKKGPAADTGDQFQPSRV